MEFKKHNAIYLQIAELICENILTDKWQVGEKISSVRSFAGQMQVNPNTVMRTYTYLQDQDIIYNKRGIGFFVSEGAVQKIHQIKKEFFVNETLPEIFRQMNLLDISISELKKHYQDFKREI